VIISRIFPFAVHEYFKTYVYSVCMGNTIPSKIYRRDKYRLHHFVTKFVYPDEPARFISTSYFYQVKIYDLF